MRPSWRRRALVLGTLSVSCWAGEPARANGHLQRAFAPTGYYVSTEYVVPSSYVVPTYSVTSYVLNASYAYVAPTTYTTTAAYLPAYESTSYFVPTSYYYPASLVVPTVYEADPCGSPCDDPCGTVTTAPREYVLPATAGSSPRAAAPSRVSGGPGASSAVKPPASLSSQPETATIPDNPPPAPEPTSKRQPAPSGPASNPASIESTVSPPAAPAADRDLPNTPSGTLLTPTGPSGTTPASGGRSTAPGGTPGTAPAGKPATPAPPAAQPPVELPPPPAPGGDETVRYQAQRPVLPANRPASQPYLRSAKKGNLGVFEGKVIGSDSRLPEEGVRVVVSNRMETYADRPVVTDAFGRFAVRLPDGDWTVKVTMPSGRSYAVSQLTVTQGQIVDDLGRDVPSLTITR